MMILFVDYLRKNFKEPVLSVIRKNRKDLI